MRLIIGLGNPGIKYRKTRHNIGFRLVDILLKNNTILAIKKRKSYVCWETLLENEKTVLVRGKTFMNESGIYVSQVLRDFYLKPEDMFVFCDDVNLPLGKIRIRRSGSSGGHKGLQSVIEQLGTERFPRVRLGVGRENMGFDLVRFVLSSFSRQEEEEVKKMLDSAHSALKIIMTDGLEKAMAQYNG